MQKLLTIVVPVYKVEQYINKCLDSCIIYREDGSLDEEKMNQLEVIIVNDGTPDRSAEMSREYTVRYPKTFRQIDQENRGHGGAWNHGLQEATGKYLRFLDSDDWLTNLDKLMEKLADTDADLVFTQINTFYAADGSNQIGLAGIPDGEVKSIKAFEMKDFNWSITSMNFMRCTYKKNNIQCYCPLFREGVRYDDAVLFTAPLIKATSFICYDFVLYNYFIGRAEQTMTLQNQIKFVDQRVDSYIDLYNFTQAHRSDSQCTSDVFDYLLEATYMDDFSIVVMCGYCKCKEQFNRLKKYKNEYSVGAISKQYKRFEKYPFALAYILEKIRQFKNK